MDILLGRGIINSFLGFVYLLSAVGVSGLLYNLSRATPNQYKIILSRKAFLQSFFYAVVATCLTVSYQNLAADFSGYLPWWRLFLISTIGAVSWKWWIFAVKVRKATSDVKS